MRSIANARASAVDALLDRRHTGGINLIGNVECRKMVARSMFRWYADGRCKRFGLAGSAPAAKQPEPKNAPEIARVRWLMVRPWRDPGDFQRSPGVQMIYVLVISAICLGITAVVTVPLLALFSILAAFASKPDPGKPLKPRIPSGLGRLLLLIFIFVTPLVVLMLNPGMSQEQQIDTVIINTQLIILILILTTPIASSAPITQNETQNED